jgi:hypothetical protein
MKTTDLVENFLEKIGVIKRFKSLRWFKGLICCAGLMVGSIFRF